jgi:hypothetical protein
MFFRNDWVGLVIPECRDQEDEDDEPADDTGPDGKQGQ